MFKAECKYWGTLSMTSPSRRGEKKRLKKKISKGYLQEAVIFRKKEPQDQWHSKKKGSNNYSFFYKIRLVFFLDKSIEISSYLVVCKNVNKPKLYQIFASVPFPGSTHIRP